MPIRNIEVSPDLHLIGFHPERLDSAARLFTIEEDPTLIVGAEGDHWPDLKTDETLRKYEMLVDELEEVYGIPNCGAVPVSLSPHGRGDLYVFSERIYGQRLDQAVTCGDVDAIHGAEDLYDKLTNYIISKHQKGEATIDDIFSTYQYMLPDEPADRKPVLVDMGMYITMARDELTEESKDLYNWFRVINIRHLFSDIMKFTAITGRQNTNLKRIVEFVESLPDDGMLISLTKKLMKRAYDENRDFTKDELCEIEYY